MLFNLSSCRYFPLKEKVTICNLSNTELFYGSWELRVAHPYNGNNNCYSDTNKSSYGIPIEDEKNMLTN